MSLGDGNFFCFQNERVVEGWGKFLSSEIDEKARDETADQVGNEIPSRVEIAADVGFAKHEGRHEFEDFVERTEAHARRHAKRDEAKGWVEFSSEAVLNARAERFPAEPSGEAESVGVDEVIVFQFFRNEPKRIKNGVRAVIKPRLRNGNESPSHVEKSPDGEAPEDHF